MKKKLDFPLIPSTSEKDLNKTPLEDSLARYLKEISRFELLSLEQEKALTKTLTETGDIEMAKKLVLHNLRLVVKIALEYKKAHQNVMDLIQEGNIGLMKAVSLYNPEKGAKLSYYASWWIRSYILKFILDNFRLVKLGTTNDQKKLFYNLIREKERLTQMGAPTDVKALASHLGVSEKSVKVMEKRLSPSGGEVALDAPLPSGEGSFGDLLFDGSPPVEEKLEQAFEVGILKKNLHSFVEELSERERYIFEKRLYSEVPLSLQKIADRYGLSRERVRQLEGRLLKDLRVYMTKYLR